MMRRFDDDEAEIFTEDDDLPLNTVPHVLSTLLAHFGFLSCFFLAQEEVKKSSINRVSRVGSNDLMEKELLLQVSRDF